MPRTVADSEKSDHLDVTAPHAADGVQSRSFTLTMLGQRRILVALGSIAVTLILWNVATDVTHWIGPLQLPGPFAVLRRLRVLFVRPYLQHTLWGHAAASVQVVMLGWLVAGLIGAPAGILMAWSRRFRSLTFPVFQLLRPISPIAWIPLSITWLGIDERARVFIVFIAAVVPWVLNSMEAVRSVDPLLVRAARTLGANSFETLRSVVLPAGLPTLLGGARIALGNAWTAVIAAELLAATSGLGFVALTAGSNLDSTTTVAAMIVIGAIGLLLSTIMRRVVRFSAPWAKGL